jgi:CDP-diacylglycerol--glycerol-3-phosphate 3-phosphatidyltransferase
MIRRYIGKPVESALRALARTLDRRGVSPNALTVTGLAVNLGAAWAYYAGFWFAAGLVVLFAGFFDMLDGAVARAGGGGTAVGAFIDSVVDRYSDLLMFGGILAHFASKGDLGLTLLVLAAILGAFMVSYVRARAELVIPRCDVGLMERPERIILLAAGSLFGFLELSLWALAVLTNLTSLYRIYHTVKTDRRASRSPSSSPPPPR